MTSIAGPIQLESIIKLEPSMFITALASLRGNIGMSGKNPQVRDQAQPIQGQSVGVIIVKPEIQDLHNK